MEIFYLERAQSADLDYNWVFPEKAVNFKTSMNQIILFDIQVQYSCVTVIRCRVSESVVEHIRTVFNNYVEKIADIS